jgi:nitrite reductase/ring-hydroxylating ferredoxin subunit
MSSELIFLCVATDVPPAGVKQVRVKVFEEYIAVYHLDGAYYATDDMCTHAMVSLSAGEVADGQIFCPLHGGAFDIRTGTPTELPCRVKLKTYPVKTIDDKLYLVTE